MEELFTVIIVIVYLGFMSAIVAGPAYGVYVLLGELRYSTGIGLRWRWIDPVLGTVAGIVVLLYVSTLFYSGPRGLFSDAATSVSNAPGP